MKILLGLKRFDVHGLAEMLLKKELVSMARYEWYSRNRDHGKWANGDVGVLVSKSLELRVKKSRKGLVWVVLSRVGRKMVVGILYVSPE